MGAAKLAKANGSPAVGTGQPSAVRLATTGAHLSERVPLFYIDDQVYTIAAKPRPNVALRYMYTLKTRGEQIATAQLLEDLLGHDAYLALMDHDDLEQEQLTAIMQIAQKLTMGALEAATSGN